MDVSWMRMYARVRVFYAYWCGAGARRELPVGAKAAGVSAVLGEGSVPALVQFVP